MNSLESCAPKFDGLIPRTTGEQITRVKGYLPNCIAMAFDGSQQTTSVRVPKNDGVSPDPLARILLEANATEITSP
jgi:hypothetical protein